MSIANIFHSFSRGFNFGFGMSMMQSFSWMGMPWFGGCGCFGGSVFHFYPETLSMMDAPMPMPSYGNMNLATQTSLWNQVNYNSNYYSSNMLGFDSFNSSFQVDYSNFNGGYNVSYTNMFAGTTGVSGTKSSKKTYTGSLKDYNSSVGNRLANLAKQNAKKTYDSNRQVLTDRVKSEYESTGWCAAHVNRTIGSVTGIQTSGDAADVAASLRRHSGFKEIDPNTSLSSLPAGCVVVYGRGVAGYSSQSGHVEITNGDGTATSDFTHQMKTAKPTAIFIPV